MTEIAIFGASVTAIGIALVMAAGWHTMCYLVPWARLLVGVCCLGLFAVGVLTMPSKWSLINIVVLLGAVGVVLVFERLIVSVQALVAFIVVAAVVDAVSFTGGFTRTIIEQYRTGDSQLLLYLSLVAPYQGRLVPIVGITDLAIGGTVVMVLSRHGYRFFPIAAGIAAGLLCALGFGLWSSGGVPAEPFEWRAVYRNTFSISRIFERP